MLNFMADLIIVLGFLVMGMTATIIFEGIIIVAVKVYEKINWRKRRYYR